MSLLQAFIPKQPLEQPAPLIIFGALPSTDYLDGVGSIQILVPTATTEVLDKDSAFMCQGYINNCSPVTSFRAGNNLSGIRNKTVILAFSSMTLFITHK
jgi:hypothetical protein